MRWVPLLAAVASLGFASRLTAADLSKIDRTIPKEPAYATKAPRYCLLVFGPDAAHLAGFYNHYGRVWVIKAAPGAGQPLFSSPQNGNNGSLLLGAN